MTPSGSPPSDERLLQAWSNGDAAAAQALIERHFDAITRFFRTKAGAQAQDLTQQTFLRCAEARARYSGKATFRAFLFGIARNVLFEHYREKSRGRADPDFRVTGVADLSPGAFSMLGARDEQRLLVQALQRLPMDLQSVLELYYWEEMGIEDLAAVFEIPPGTVKSRLHRARKLLRETLDQVPADDETRRSVKVILDCWAPVDGTR